MAIPGVRVGHVTDAEGQTGCTVVLLDQPAVASGEVRGSAPATREFALLDPTATVSRIDAVVLSGGSAFGLAAADGVVAELEAEGVGFETDHGIVPIVVGMSLYDLGVGASRSRPVAEDGRVATQSATTAFMVGKVGAGTGATVGKWRDAPTPGGLVHARAEAGPLVVEALIAVNAYGDVITPDSREALAGMADGTFDWSSIATPFRSGENTTIGVIITNAELSKTECRLVAESGHDGMARAIFPAHTGADGDALVAVSRPLVDAPLAQVRTLAAVVVEKAITSLAEPRP
ncbi:MAG: peptidase S58 family protein [Acidimicrobiales bacterium]|nr:MAG: peptidase S58 family protein [Acidimicrobiales bacterium]